MNPWDDVFGEVPASFEKMVRDTLAGLEEQPNETDRIKRKLRPAWRTVLIAAVVAVLLAGTSLAVAISSGFLQSAFGPKGWEDSAASDGYPAWEWEAVDEENAAAVAGSYVTEVGKSVLAGEYVFTVDAYLLDGNGYGAVTYSLRRVDGGPIPGYSLQDEGRSGRFELDYEWLLSGPIIETKSGCMIEGHQVLDNSLTTETELHGVLYLDSMEELPEDDIIYLFMNLREEEQIEFLGELQTASFVVGESERVALRTDVRIPAKAFSDGENTVWLSPISMTLGRQYTKLGGDHSVTIRYTDGSEYVVTDETEEEDGRVWNAFMGGYMTHRRSWFYIFNRLVDVERVESITIGGSSRIAGTYTPDPDAVRTLPDPDMEEAYRTYLIGWMEQAQEGGGSLAPETISELDIALEQGDLERFLYGYSQITGEEPMTYEQFAAAGSGN